MKPPPLVSVPQVIEFEPGKRAVGVKNVTMNEPQFTGHFPDRPIMPGVLMIEAMAQLGGIVCLQPPVSDGTGVFFFAGINGVRWRRPVVPGVAMCFILLFMMLSISRQVPREGGGIVSQILKICSFCAICIFALLKF